MVVISFIKKSVFLKRTRTGTRDAGDFGMRVGGKWESGDIVGDGSNCEGINQSSVYKPLKCLIKLEIILTNPSPPSLYCYTPGFTQQSLPL
jgi:hypothetical protein